MSDSALIKSPDFGCTLLPSGVRVALNPNPVELSVYCAGPEGKVLTVEVMGIRIGLSLTDRARDHLVALLQSDEPASQKAAA